MSSLSVVITVQVELAELVNVSDVHFLSVDVTIEVLQAIQTSLHDFKDGLFAKALVV